MQLNLPPGVNAAMIAATLQYLQAQAEQNAPRPSGLLQKHMIRGVNKNYKYEYREFPKALTPPDIEVADAKQERQLRVKWSRPLPWDATKPEGQALIAQYYEEQVYPKRETPPQIVVQDANEEASVRAAWQMEYGESAGIIYPAWFFHVTKQPVMVSNSKQRDALGKGWFATPSEAMDAAKGITAPVKLDEQEEREALIRRADELGVSYDMRMKTPKIKQLVQQAEREREEA